jgi:hypothetical protein
MDPRCELTVWNSLDDRIEFIGSIGSMVLNTGQDPGYDFNSRLSNE